MFLRTIRIIFRVVLRVLARVSMTGYENIPSEGGAIVVSNHIGRLDAMIGVVVSDRDDIILMIADKYHDVPLWRWLGDHLDAIWLDREEVDFHSMREVFRRLKAGGLLGIAPEGTRSKSEALVLGKPGAAYLASRSQLPLIPVGISGTEDRLVKQKLKRLQRLDITIKIGEPFMLPPLPRKDREEFLEESTDEIMCRIAALLPPKYRGVYKEYPRVSELISEQERLPS
ncbi:MAG: lysophospholipid acyltransferase family protein [Candidatus Promineifilaceae bacterium]|jgi:1-acyl-sn-glycerol-3-phosphate acyltransferase